MLDEILKLMASPLGKYVMAIIFCIASVVIIDRIIMVIKKILMDKQIKKSIKLIEFFEKFIFPIFPIIFSILLAFTWKLQKSFILNFISYLGIIWFIFKIGYKALVNFVVKKVKGK